MKSLLIRQVVALVLVSVSGMAAADQSRTFTTTGKQANRIAGLWTTQAEVRPCGTEVPPFVIVNTLLIHANGTIIEMPLFPPNGAYDVSGIPGLYQRGQALGTWTYNPKTDKYRIRLRFDNYVDNAYHGHATVDRVARMTPNGMRFRGPVSVARYALDGSVIFQLCGKATNTRL